MGHYTQLSIDDRQTFHRLRLQGYPVRSIAKQLGRHHSTLYRELSRHSQATGYDPYAAHTQAITTQSQQRKSKIQRHVTLRKYIVDHLKLGWSPEQISGRLKRKKSKYIICHETIYRYIYRLNNKKLYQYLRYKKPKRRRKFARKHQVCRYGNKRIITERFKCMDKRFVYGHWEGDLIEFKGDKKRSVTTLLERKTKLVLLIKNDNKTTNTVMGSIANMLIKIPTHACQTITFDQGNEFANYQRLEKAFNCRVFYCHKSSPWEKGSNENTNGRLRRFLPKRADIKNITQEKLDEVMKTMNNTPRKCLDYRTPKELFLSHFKPICRTLF